MVHTKTHRPYQKPAYLVWFEDKAARNEALAGPDGEDYDPALTWNQQMLGTIEQARAFIIKHQSQWAAHFVEGLVGVSLELTGWEAESTRSLTDAERCELAGVK